MAIKSNHPKVSCNNQEIHEEHLWAKVVDPKIGRSHPSGWRWAYCEGVKSDG